MASNLRKIILSVCTIAIIAIGYLFVTMQDKNSNLFHGDALGYYSYLPAKYIYHNEKQLDSFPDVDIPYSIIYDMKHLPATPLGYKMVQYTYGVALMESPFFFMAHSIAKNNGLAANGYSGVYHKFILISSFFYTLLALLFTYLILKRYFSITISYITILLLFIGTNLFWFSLKQGGMSHSPLFFLYSVLTYLSIKIDERPRIGIFILAGLICGLITLIRPSDVVCILIPLLFNVYNKETLKRKLSLLKANIPGILVAIAVFMIPVIPQLLYWKEMTGNYFYYSYGTQTFNWTKPKIIEGLFYFQNGWIAYSPVMIFSLLGLFLYKRFRQFAFCIPVVFIIYIYIIYSWYCYTYINGLGSRPMIHIYTLMAIPLAAYIQRISEKALHKKIIFTTLVLLFISFNISYSIQQEKRLLISDESNLAFALSTMYKDHINYNDFVTYNVEECQPLHPEKLVLIDTLACVRYEDSVDDHYVPDETHRSKFVYQMRQDEHHPGTIKAKYTHARFKGAKWVKCSGRFKCTEWIDYFQHLFVLTVSQNDKFLKWDACKIDSKIGLADSSCQHRYFTLDHFDIDKWGYVYFYARLPRKLYDGDDVMLDVWNIGKKQLYMDDITLEIYK